MRYDAYKTVDKMTEIAGALSDEVDINIILNMILDSAMEIAACEAGTLYLIDGKRLQFHVIRNQRLKVYNRNIGECDLPPVPLRPEYACSLAVLKDQIVLIDDVYSNEYSNSNGSSSGSSDALRINNKGSMEYDKKTGYHTQSMMIVPLKFKNKPLGSLQLINAMDENGVYIPFPEECRRLVEAFAAQASLALGQAQYQAEMTVMRLLLAERENGRLTVTDEMKKILQGYIDRTLVKGPITKETVSQVLDSGKAGSKFGSTSGIRSGRRLNVDDPSTYKEVGAYLKNNQSNETVLTKLNEYINRDDRKDTEIARDANISRSTFSGIINGRRNPKKYTLIALAIALKLSMEETEELLSLHGDVFMQSEKRDLIISYFIRHNDMLPQKNKLGIMDFNVALNTMDEPMLGELPV